MDIRQYNDEEVNKGKLQIGANLIFPIFSTYVYAIKTSISNLGNYNVLFKNTSHHYIHITQFYNLSNKPLCK